MSKETIIALLLFSVVVVVALIYVGRTPAKVDPECTTEYVQINGEKDCENRMKANEAESDAIQESQMR